MGRFTYVDGPLAPLTNALPCKAEYSKMAIGKDVLDGDVYHYRVASEFAGNYKLEYVDDRPPEDMLKKLKMRWLPMPPIVRRRANGVRLARLLSCGCTRSEMAEIVNVP